MADIQTVATSLTFVTMERKDTRNGKERYMARTVDGRDFGIWDRNLANAVNGHLHEELLCEVSTKQDDRGTWWNTLQSVPALGVAAVDTRGQSGGGGGAPPAPALDGIASVLERIALALENLVSFEAAKSILQAAPQPTPQSVPVQASVSTGAGPDWPNDQ